MKQAAKMQQQMQEAQLRVLRMCADGEEWALGAAEAPEQAADDIVREMAQVRGRNSGGNIGKPLPGFKLGK